MINNVIRANSYRFIRAVVVIRGMRAIRTNRHGTSLPTQIRVAIDWNLSK